MAVTEGLKDYHRFNFTLLHQSQYPHCDSRILHSPGKCMYCDKHPEWQELRLAWHIAFTGDAPAEGWLPCPADHARPPADRATFPPLRLILGRMSAPDIEGLLRKDGSIEVGGQVFSTPSAAARHALDVGSVDGWLRWRVPRLGRCTLASIRDAQ